jgi:hypothetical protein
VRHHNGRRIARLHGLGGRSGIAARVRNRTTSRSSLRPCSRSRSSSTSSQPKPTRRAPPIEGRPRASRRFSATLFKEQSCTLAWATFHSPGYRAASFDRQDISDSIQVRPTLNGFTVSDPVYASGNVSVALTDPLGFTETQVHMRIQAERGRAVVKISSDGALPLSQDQARDYLQHVVDQELEGKQVVGTAIDQTGIHLSLAG